MRHSEKKLKISVKSIEMFFVYLIFLKPGSTEYVAFLDILFNIGRFGLSIVFVAFIFLKRKPIITIIWPLGIMLVSLFSTWMYGGLYWLVFKKWVPIIGMMAWIELNKNSLNRIIRYFFRIGSLLIIINAVIILILPRGFFWTATTPIQIWLLGQKQDFVTCFLPTFAFGLMSVRRNRSERYLLYLVVLCGSISLMIAKPVGLILCLILLMIVLGVERLLGSKLKIGLLGAANVFGEIAAILIAFMYTGLPKLQAFLSGIQFSGVSKDSTMSGRFQMWIYSLASAAKHPLFGVGQITQSQWFGESDLSFYHTIIHNLPLDILFIGGGISLALFLLWNYIAIRRLRTEWWCREIRILGIGLFCVNFIGITECPYNPIIFSLFAMAIHADNITGTRRNKPLFAVPGDSRGNVKYEPVEPNS